ncbi:MAG: PilC/PilY family type IV pilus protein [Brachymonas sp.]|nr:PilC/PilY family type IV pilus protein [Brachymonas sp.]
MTNKTTTIKHGARVLSLAVALAGLAVISSAVSQPVIPARRALELNPGPFSVVDEASNIALALSVEYPTVGAAYKDDQISPTRCTTDRRGETTCSYSSPAGVNASGAGAADVLVRYVPTKKYMGYWDPDGCYKYKDPAAGAPLGGEYFYRTGTRNATTGYCNNNGASNQNEYTGNLLNFAATSSIDILRLAMTGGHREVDTEDTTILARAYLSDNSSDGDHSKWKLHTYDRGWNQSFFPSRIIAATLLGREMPAAPYGSSPSGYVFSGSCQNVIWFGQRRDAELPCTSPSRSFSITSDDLNRNLNPANPSSTGARYLPMYARVKVCDDSEKTSRKDLCKQYSAGNYKPQGEVQKKSEGAKIGAFGYLSGNAIPGGVMRAPISFIGPTVLNENGIEIANPNAEWDMETGVFKNNPRNATGGFAYSGVINYLNRFGTTGAIQGNYKTKDYLGGLYWETLRNFMGKTSSTAAYASGTSTNSNPAADGFPFYTNWSGLDPISSTCSRKNFILTIGDVNATAATLATENNINPASLANTLVGYEGIAYRNLLDWTGAAWAANTRPIRTDTDSSGASNSQVRVRTFTIDVDEGGNGNIDNPDRRGSSPRRDSLYLAGKYGWFKDGNGNGRPDAGEWDEKTRNVPDGYVIASQAEKLFEGIKDFFAASSDDRASIFSTALSSTSFSAVSATGDVFLPELNPAKWTGSIVKMALTYDQATNGFALSKTPAWDAATILTTGKLPNGDAALAWSDRKVFTYSRDADKLGGQRFSVANKAKLDTAVVAALNKDPSKGANDPAVIDNKADGRINFILGDRSNEKSGDGTGTFRMRSSLMGDVVGSGPVYKKEVDSWNVDADYSTFASGTTVKNRRPAVYTGANDGMLHAFDADTGQELFAYIPRAVAENLNRLTNPLYAHTQFVDAVPAVNEVQIYTSTDPAETSKAWKTVLVSGMGGGAQGVFALDVTDPGNFDASKVLFEFTDQDDPDMGNVTSPPRIVKIKRIYTAGNETKSTYRWYVAVSSGYNNYADDGRASTSGVQSLFLLSLDKKPGEPWSMGALDGTDNPEHNYYKISVNAPSGPAGSPAGLANPGVAKDIFGTAKIFYAGDLEGNLWKFDLSSGLNAKKANEALPVSGGSKVPLAIFKDRANKIQPITSAPVVTTALNKGYMVLVGTGKYMEGTDNTTDADTVQSVYGVWDDGSTEAAGGNYDVNRSKLYTRRIDTSGPNINKTTGESSFVFGTGAGKYRGWAVDLPAQKERIVLEGSLGPNYVGFTSVIPPTNECSSSGDGASMGFCTLYGSTDCGPIYRSIKGYPGRLNILYMDDTAASDYSYGKASATRRRDVLIKTRSGPVSSTKDLDLDPSVSQVRVPAGRVSWREIRQFRE